MLFLFLLLVRPGPTPCLLFSDSASSERKVAISDRKASASAALVPLRMRSVDRCEPIVLCDEAVDGFRKADVFAFPILVSASPPEDTMVSSGVLQYSLM